MGDNETLISLNWITMGIWIALGLFAIFLIVKSFFTVSQGTVSVITRWGKYKKISLPGLNWKVPFLDKIMKEISTQNRSISVEFQAITQDQANVKFSTMLLVSVRNSGEDTIKLVAFKFSSDKDLNLALNKTIEGSIRSFVATKRQSEILSLRGEVVDHVKGHVDKILEDWGYHLIDLQINDISFDKAITDSMSQVVASSNLRAAAENEGQALLIKKTKAAEAEGKAIMIQAEAERTAAELRGQGVAAFRRAVSEGIRESAEELDKANIGTEVIMFSMWTEAIKNFAEVGKGNMIFLDGSQEGMQQSLKRMMAVSASNSVKSS